MAHHNDTTQQGPERYFMIDVLRLLCMLAIGYFHLHEATFFANTHVGEAPHGLFEVMLEPAAKWLGFSGFSIIFLSYFLIGLRGLSSKKFKQLLFVSLIGAFALFIIFLEESHYLLQWDVYHFIAYSSLMVAILNRWTPGLYGAGVLGALLILLPPHFWNFPQWHEHWFYSGLFGSYQKEGGGGWPLIPWLGLPVAAFALGRFLKNNPQLITHLRKLRKNEFLVWILILTVSSLRWGTFSHCPAGADFYKYVQNVSRLDWLAHMVLVFCMIRLGFVRAINQWAQKKTWVNWISHLYLNKRFFFFYLVHWMVIGLFSNFDQFFLKHPAAFDMVVLGLFPLSEFLCHSLLKGSKEILAYFSSRLRAAP